MKARHIAFAVVWLVVVASVAFGSAQKEGTAAQAQQLGVLFHQSNIPDDKIVQEYAQTWAEERGVNLNFQIVDESELRSKTVAAIESQSGPDLILFPDYTAYLYRENLTNIDGLVNGLADAHGGWFPIAEQAFRFEGHWKAIPYKTFVKPIAYRKDILEQVGESEPQTWQELADVTTKISNEVSNMYGFGVAIAPRSDGPNFIRTLLWSFGGSIQDEDGNVALNSPESVEAFSFLKEWHARGGMAPGVAGWDDSDNNRAFMAQRISMTYNASSVYLTARTDFPDTLGKVTGHLMIPEGPAGTIGNASSQGLGIPLYSQNRNLAEDFLEFMYTPDRLQRITMETDGGATMMLNDVVADLPLWDNPDLAALLEVSKVSYLTGYPGKMNRGAAAVRSEFILVNAAGRMLAEDLTPEEAIESATRQIEDVYARYQ